MSKPHELLSRKPFDLYQLHLFRLVAESGSFTRAAQVTGLTQSAITRQIQSIEQQLGLSLLNRTTRSVTTTAAGKFLLQESASVLGDVDNLLRRLREDYADAPRASIISRVTHESSQTILTSLESDALDVGVLLPPSRLSNRLRITHRFRDAFTLVGNESQLLAARVNMKKSAELGRWLESQPWLGLQETTQTGRRLNAWLKQQKLNVRPAMELDNFDLIINLVALGVGVSLVPQRALALYARRRALVRVPWPKRFARELVVVVRRQRQTPEHIQRFVENILF
jgi:DNA-binding transcriptional LysR family regulator